MLTGIVVLVVVFASALMLAWHFRRARDMVEGWARQHGYRLEAASYCWFWRGPYWIRSNSGHAVYRITVCDLEGRRRRGWARCGGWFLGLWSDRVDVRLDP